DVTVSADGYVSQTVESVDVGPEERVEVSFVLYNVGIEGSGQLTFNGDFSVFPNPAAGSCSFSLPFTGVGGTVSIYDITGRSLFVEDVSQETSGLSWDLRDAEGSPVPSGMYIARFHGGGSDWSTRLIVNR
ncbi:MAG: T9SS type A sorting domain-containing protein, partial [Candidatus Fermentibacteraceae bacterium]|nr:T9SS type A sorting domain-containing protein [Candidatus Fermentibacteraceae bacterium]